MPQFSYSPSSASWAENDYETIISTLDRSLFILIGFLIKEELSKKCN